MFEDDPEASRLSQLPGVEELIESYKVKYVEVCKKLFEFGLQGRIKRKEETESFFTAIYEAVQNNLNASVEHIDKFDRNKTKVSVLVGLWVKN